MKRSILRFLSIMILMIVVMGCAQTFPIRSVAFDSQERLYAGGEGAVYRSADRGESWEQLAGESLEQKELVVEVKVSPAGDLFILTRLGDHWRMYRSCDAGESWERLASSRRLRRLAFASTGEIFAVDYESLYVSIDNGEVWEEIGEVEDLCDVDLSLNSMQDHSSVGYLAVDSSDRLYMDTIRGLYRSVDGGTTWDGPLVISLEEGEELPEDYEGPLVTGIVLDQEGFLVVGSQDRIMTKSSSVAASVAFGVVTGAAYFPQAQIRNGSGGIRVSGDDGRTATFNFETGVSCLVEGSNPGEFYAATYDSRTQRGVDGDLDYVNGFSMIVRSEDGGESWRGSVPCWGNENTTVVYAFAVNDDGILFAGTNYGIFRSRNHGRTWEDINQGLIE